MSRLKRMRLTTLSAAWMTLVLLPAAPAVAEVRAVLISLDGMRPDAITPDHAPRMMDFMLGGISARALNDFPSITIPNHTSMLTGLTTARHRIVFNDTQPGRLPYKTLLDYAHAAGLRTAFFASKDKFQFLANNEISDPVVITNDIDGMVDRVIDLIGPDGPQVIFLHLREPDVTGHAHGWMSSEYMATVGRVDALVGRLLDRLERQAADGGPEPYVLITADHGGIDRNHYLDVEVDRLIPWMLRGPDIPPGKSLSEEVSTVDSTPTLLWLLGLEVPDGLSGHPIVAVRETGEPSLSRTELPVPAVGTHPHPFRYYWRQVRGPVIAGAISALVVTIIVVVRKRRKRKTVAND